ncbi:Kunitz/Bovine pancreatic trypsin inhibitor domain protein [Ancylostoma duodenale]|uniref:Kunitz/Bovine pancreatic trypsin inhibitor domain protein n=1 Tax=Ancylostoma duodenale TaxID=51022 RepID=A0A0C2GEA8_9BILA|nr:Kunitz/Bovine pancreatic trypsin inhibitor domain protein [Ancylostoma duodenale]
MQTSIQKSQPQSFHWLHDRKRPLPQRSQPQLLGRPPPPPPLRQRLQRRRRPRLQQNRPRRGLPPRHPPQLEPPLPGQLLKQAPRWAPVIIAEFRRFFNAQSGQCEQFSYGSCGGNENNFVDRSLCELKCIQSK